VAIINAHVDEIRQAIAEEEALVKELRSQTFSKLAEKMSRV
jgi:fido (protein-threonine AMPylation protein)